MYRTKSSIFFLLITVFSLMSIGTVFAQDEDLTVVEPVDGYEFSMPEGWDYDYNDENFAYFFNGDHNLDFDFYFPEDLEEQEIPFDDLIGATEAVFYTVDEDITFDDVDVEETTFDDLDIIRIDFTDTFDGQNYPVVFVTMYMDDGSFIYGKIYPVEGDDDIPSDIIDDSLFILSSLSTIEADLKTVEPIKGYEFSIPEAWDFDHNDDNLAYFFNGNYNLNFDFYFPEDLEEQDIPSDDLIGATEAVFFTADEDITFDDVAAEETTFNDLDIVRVDFTDNFEGESYPVVFVTMYLEDGSFIYGKIYPVDGDDDIPSDIIDDSLLILSSLTIKE